MELYFEKTCLNMTKKKTIKESGDVIVKQVEQDNLKEEIMIEESEQGANSRESLI